MEVFLGGLWYDTEEIILDKTYLGALKKKLLPSNGPFMGYGVAVDECHSISVDFNLNNTYIQKEGINADYGVYNSNDMPLSSRSQKMSRLKAFLYSIIGRRIMNRNVRRIREGR